MTNEAAQAGQVTAGINKPVYIILDTNMFLHFQRPDEIDWLAWCSAQDVRLVVYPLLMTELSNAKDLHPQKHLRRRAGDREAWLRDRLKHLGKPVRQGVLLHRDTADVRNLFGELGLDPRVNDDLIIALAAFRQREGLDIRVATADGGLQMKLEDHGIPVLVPDDRWRLQAEPDPERARAEKAERELKAQRDRLPKLLLSWLELAPLCIQQDIGSVSTYVEEGLCTAETKYRQIQTQRCLPTFDSIRDPRHATELAEASSFLREQHAWLARAHGAARFRLQIQNAGTLSASAIRARLFQSPGLLIYGPGGLAGKPRRMSHRTEAFFGIPVCSAGDAVDLDHLIPQQECLPRIDREAGFAEFTWNRIPQLSQTGSVAFWIVATRAASPGIASLRTEILCDEVGGPRYGRLEVQIVQS